MSSFNPLCFKTIAFMTTLCFTIISNQIFFKYICTISRKNHKYLLVLRFKYFQNWLLSPVILEFDFLLESFSELIHRYKSFVTIHTIIIFFTHLSFAAMTLKQYNVILQVYDWNSVSSQLLITWSNCQAIPRQNSTPTHQNQTREG